MIHWLEYESGGLFEYSPDVVLDAEIIMPRYAHDGISWGAAYVQRYRDKSGKLLWRSLDYQRKIFRSGYASREAAAQEIVRDNKDVRRRIAARRLSLLRRARGWSPGG